MIDIKKLHKVQDNRHQIKINGFKKILKLCCTYIEQANKIGETMLDFIVPEFMFGLPIYEVKECSIYILGELNEIGMEVEYIVPNRLLISWSKIT
jgi:hypothetical protein